MISSPVAEIKEKLSIIDVVSSYVKLEKAGIYQKAKCPFHNERTPSFFVSPGRGTYHCFGCGKGGDIFTFVQEIEGIDFPAALKLLANRAGVKLGEFNAKAESETSTLYDILEESTIFYEHKLKDSKEAIDYLKSRGLEGKTAKEFRLGVAPDAWSMLVEHLTAKGFSEKLIESSGMGIHGKNGLYDRFRNRIMFPIFSSQGKVVAFTGRVMPSAPADAGGKYVNSPETALYHKSTILYGYHKAKQAMLKSGTALFVEGQMDLIMAHQAGNENVVAVSGTALTREHLALVKRFANTILFSFDADSAGETALQKATLLAISLGAEAKAIKIPSGKDPADLIKENVSEWTEAVKNAKPVIEYLFEKIQNESKDKQEKMRQTIKTVLPLIAVMPQKIEQSHFIKRTAEFLGIDEEAVRTDLERVNVPNEIIKEIPQTSEVPRAVSPHERIQMQIIGFYLAFKEKIDVKKIDEMWQMYCKEPIENTINNLDKEKANALAMEAEMYFEEREDLDHIMTDLIQNFSVASLEEELGSTLAQLREAEQRSDHEKAKILMKESHAISQKINDIKNSRSN